MTRVFSPAFALAMAIGSTLVAGQTAPPKNLPYAAVHDPEFIKAADAVFMSGEDRVIGLTSGAIAKAYPAAILSQHGLVEDRSPAGPIAVTW